METSYGCNHKMEMAPQKFNLKRLFYLPTTPMRFRRQ